MGVVGGYFSRNAATAAGSGRRGGGAGKVPRGPGPPRLGSGLRTAPASPPPPPGGMSGARGVSPTSLPVFGSYLRTVNCPMYTNPLLSTAMPWPCGCSGVNEPITFPSLSIWIIDGGRVQHSAVGGFFAACNSVSLRSLGRSSTHTLSSLSTANPVTPPIFHLFRKGLGQSGSNLYFGADCVCAPTPTHNASKQRPPKAPNALIHMLRSILVFMGLLPHRWVGLDPTARSLFPDKSVCQ